MEDFHIWADEVGNDDTSALSLSDSVSTRDLVADTEVTITVPTGARFAIFQSDVTHLWVGSGSTPITVPTGTNDDLDVSLNPNVRYISGVTTLRLISASPGQAVVTFYG